MLLCIRGEVAETIVYSALDEFTPQVQGRFAGDFSFRNLWLTML
ncbi:hypothetical protein [Pontibacter sp. Tf4]|nr:hypothetical protein [Pontibacter sp. Tf4]